MSKNEFAFGFDARKARRLNWALLTLFPCWMIFIIFTLFPCVVYRSCVDFSSVLTIAELRPCGDSIVQ